MAEALIGGMLAAHIAEPASIVATDPIAGRRDVLKARFGIQVEGLNTAAARSADIVVLAVKPQAMPGLLSEVGPILAGKLVISVAAGVTIAWIRERIAAPRGIVRAMPNTPIGSSFAS